MSFLSGLLRTVAPLALAAVTGGTSLAIQTAMRAVMSAVAQQVIQQLGQKLGLPPAIINMAQMAFANSSGQPGLGQTNFGDVTRDLGREFGLSPSQLGGVERSMDDATSGFGELIDNMMRQITAEGKKAEYSSQSEKFGSTSGKKGFLYAIAAALGEAVDKQMNEMVKLSGQIKEQTAQNQAFTNTMSKDGNAKQSSQSTLNSQKLGTLTAELQAASQQMGILQNVTSTVLKSIGEAQSTIARKN
jgi:hypothetical protein